MTRHSDTPQQLSLLDWVPPNPVVRFDPNLIRANQFTSRLSRAISVSPETCGRSREQIAAEMSAMLEKPVSINMLNAYASVQREGHQISVPRFDALIEAVYHAELDRLADAAPVLAAQHPPVEALRAWMRLFVDYIAAKLVIAPALNGLAGGTGALYAQSGTVLLGAIDGLVAAAVASGDISADIEPVDLLRALAGVSNYAAGPGWETSAKRLVDILIAGSRVSAS